MNPPNYLTKKINRMVKFIFLIKFFSFEFGKWVT
jgi:hypothetical protein